MMTGIYIKILVPYFRHKQCFQNCLVSFQPDILKETSYLSCYDYHNRCLLFDIQKVFFLQVILHILICYNIVICMIHLKHLRFVWSSQKLKCCQTITILAVRGDNKFVVITDCFVLFVCVFCGSTSVSFSYLIQQYI